MLLLAGGLALALLAAQPSAVVAGIEPTTLSAAATAPTTAAATTTGSTLTSPARSVLVVSGHGWGHGLGLSQWGAYGYAKHGWTYDRILAHYYAGTTLGAAASTTVRVLVASGTRVTLSSAAPWTVTDDAGQTATLAPGPLVLKRVLTLAGEPALTPPFTFASSMPIAVGKVLYRGKLVASSDGKTLQVVDAVDLEQYLKGVVATEMPSSWPPEALKAQAVAARSYALANLATDRSYDLYGDTRSQGYGGVAAETPSTSAAVDETKGQIVLYRNKVADTLYFSSSGGRTASAFEATGITVPYLVPVSDPYDTLSPYHDWGPVLFDAAKVAKTLKLSAPIVDLQVANGASGRVGTVTVVANDGSLVTLTGNQVRGALGLRSTWFTPALLQLLPAAKTLTYGGTVSLTGLARGVDALSLESKTAAAPDWAPAGDLVLGPDGSFATVVQPQVTTQYRLVWGNVRAGLAKIAVAPQVEATASLDGVQGSIVPAGANAVVYLQQQTGTTWVTRSSTVTDAAGAWRFAGPITPGSYRIRCSPGQGLVAGFSPTLVVQ